VNVHDIAVVGSGPAGWATAAACSGAGLDCVLISPTPSTVWANTYGGWAEDFAAEIPFAHRWDRVVVQGDKRHQVARAYAQLDNDALFASLQSRFTGKVIKASAAGVTHQSSSDEMTTSTVALTGSRQKTVSASLVIDASGGGTALIERVVPAEATPVLQTAYGIIAEIEGMPEPGAATTMDWRGPDRDSPSFLYALDYGDGLWLVEETSLACRGGLSEQELERRLHARLAKLGARIIKVHRTEKVRFVMDLPLPVIPQSAVGIGAAAAVVHPATGYSVASSLRLGPEIAKRFLAWHDLPERDRTVGLSAHVWDAVWPADRLAARRLEQYGMERTLLMDQRTVRSFFDAFFTLPTRDIATYMSGTSTQTELAAVMWKVFNAAPLRVRTKLAAGNPLRLAKALLG
jgi:lycopene beta-cyclase